MKLKAPCKKDCAGRNETCHATCKAYTEWKEQHELIRLDGNKDKRTTAEFRSNISDKFRRFNR